jgi:hypothetical protein
MKSKYLELRKKMIDFGATNVSDFPGQIFEQSQK